LAPSKGVSKKELVLSLARKDPFLRVEEIARQAGTTAPYVRTVLSEGRVSLSRLRKAYAKEMERQLGSDPPLEVAGAPAPVAVFDALEAISPLRVVEVDALEAKRLREEWGVQDGTRLVRVERIYRSEAGILAVRRIVIAGEAVGGGGVRTEAEVISSLEAHVKARVRPGGIAIEVVAADPGTAALLCVQPGSLLYVVRCGLSAAGETVAVEELVFGAEDARVVVPGARAGVVLERRESFPGALSGELMA